MYKDCIIFVLLLFHVLTWRGGLNVVPFTVLCRPMCGNVSDIYWVGDVVQWRDSGCGGYGELKQFENKSVLFIGDSQSRRLARTLRLLLRNTTENISKKELDYDPVVHGFLRLGGGIDFQWAPCLKDMIKRSGMFRNYTIVFLSYGAHALRCKEDYRAISILRGDNLIWRTQPFPSMQVKNITHLEIIGEYARSVWDPTRLHDHQMLIHVGSRDREERINGNSMDHLGHMARIAMLQYSNKLLSIY